jgi:hypothetical protein
MEPLGAFNQPVYRSYSQLRAALLNDLGTPFADYFARPDFDSDAARIGWVAHELGEPRRWIDLSPDEHARLDPVRQRLQDGFTAYREQLEAAPENSTRGNFGKLLAQALRVPGMQYLYVLGDQPVVAFWGFRSASTNSAVDPLMVAAGSVTLGSGAASGAGATTVVAGTATRRRLGWWWWLLGLLLLLLLLALLWWWFVGSYGRSGIWIEPPLRPKVIVPPEPLRPSGPLVSPEPNPGVDHGPTLRDQVPAGPGRSDVIPPVHEGTVPGVPHDETEPNRSDNNGDVVAPPCSGPAPCGPVNPGNPDSDKLDNKTPPADRLPGTQDKQHLPDPDVVSPDKGGPLKGTPDHGMNGAPDKVPDNLPPLPPVQAPGEAPKRGADLTVPPQARPGPAGFMQGTWRSRSGLKLNGHPAEEFYQFNKDGKGQVVVRSRDGQMQCSGPAQAMVGPNHQLRVQESPTMSCNDGGVLPGAETTCSPQQGGGALCEGTNQDNGSHFGVRMEQVPQ